MKPLVLWLAATLLTICCWGVYGPVLHRGQEAMGKSRLRPLICVGLAYFAIAVVVPTLLLVSRGEGGDWSATGVIWSLAGGAAGAIGALGIILAFNFDGKPAVVMPLVFGCAPIVNAFITMYWARTWHEINAFFLAGLILVSMGAMMVLIFAPKAHPPSKGASPAAHGHDHSGATAKT